MRSLFPTGETAKIVHFLFLDSRLDPSNIFFLEGPLIQPLQF